VAVKTPGRASSVGLYIHVPFCGALCGYCDFFRLESPGGVPAGYEELLLAEALMYLETPKVRIDTVFFGGGTPSLLSPTRLARLMEGLGQTFDLSHSAEVTLEANPETITRENLEGWRAAGVNRLSVGIQSLAPHVLSALDRRATAEISLRALELAASAGFEHLSADCMSAVPGQRTEELRATLETLATLPLDHLSVYSLDLHPKTRLWDAVKRGDLQLPDEEAAADLFLWTHDALAKAGFEHYEVSNYARPGGRCRHNLRYWQGGETVGLGPSAWSRFRGQLYGNPRNLDAWTRAIQTNRPAPASVEILGEERQREDLVIFGLRVREGVEVEHVRWLLELDGREPDVVLKPLFDHGYALFDEGRLRLTVEGFLMSNEVLTYLLPGKWPRNP
jgi:putative oxygen-independent coproporphyrinogen III oxidase